MLATPTLDRSAYLARVATEKRELSSDVLAADGLDKWEKPLADAGMLEIGTLLSKYDRKHVLFATSSPEPGASTTEGKAIRKMISDARAQDPDKTLPSDSAIAIAEACRLLKAYAAAESSFTSIPVRIRRDMTQTTPTTAGVGGGSAAPTLTTGTPAKAKRSPDDVDKLLQNAQAERGGRQVAHDERPSKDAIEAVNKGAKHDPPYLPDFTTVAWLREGGAAFVRRCKAGREKQRGSAHTEDYLGEGAVMIDALVIGWSFRSDNSDYSHIYFSADDKIGTAGTPPVDVHIGARLSVLREVYGRLREACVLGRLTPSKVQKAVLKLYRKLSQTVHAKKCTLTAAALDDLVAAHIAATAERADARAEKERRERRHKKKKRSRRDRDSSSDSTSTSDSDSDSYSSSSSEAPSPARKRGGKKRKPPAAAATRTKAKGGGPTDQVCHYWRDKKKCPHKNCKFNHHY